MAILDAEVMFSDRQAITATGPSTNIWDAGPYGRPVGPDYPQFADPGKSDTTLIIQVVAGFDGLTSLRVDYQTSDDPTFSTGVDTLSSQTKVLADLTAGARFEPTRIPRGHTKRYARLLYTVTGTAPTQGAITAAASWSDDTSWFGKH